MILEGQRKIKPKEFTNIFVFYKQYNYASNTTEVFIMFYRLAFNSAWFWIINCGYSIFAWYDFFIEVVVRIPIHVRVTKQDIWNHHLYFQRY